MTVFEFAVKEDEFAVEESEFAVTMVSYEHGSVAEW